ncbi:MAG TPA: N-acetylmuramoyl-L-alanine amidase [Gemmatimonadaceae bacterium]|nr:N-acetylmuramoyl-L-alanine amidase [Gemmatimonadaceae bacterium]
MIALLLIALQAAPATLAVRTPTGRHLVPVEVTPAGPAVAASHLAGALPVQVSVDSTGQYTVRLAGVPMSLADGLPYVRADSTVLPLAMPPFVRQGELHLPVQLLVDVVPRLAPSRFRFDSTRGELVLLPDSSAGSPAASVADNGARAAAPPAGSAPRVQTQPASPAPERRWRVVVDAGHGGPDNGMTGPLGGGPRIVEKTITLQIAKRLRTALQERGIDVVMTRTTDTLIALADRGKIANESHADLFLSIHVNAANMRWRGPEKARGIETYFLAEAQTEDERRVEQMENSSVRFETSATASKDDPLAFVINDMAQNEHLRESQDLAAAIQGHLMENYSGPSRGVKQANYAVLRTAFMPAVLVETGFGTNVQDARILRDPAHQRQIADAIAAAVVDYLQLYERRLGASAP